MEGLRALAVSGVDAGWLSDSFAYAFMVNAMGAALSLAPLL
ncbi:metal ABC transporter permease, partial [Vibrio sp. YT-17]|nr:metal ABC transporter permease [Vibrio sp. YT-17]